MNPAFDSKLPNTGTTIFSHMSQLASESGAINLGQGFPDFSGPAELLQRVTYHMQAGHNQYAPLPGVAELREQIALKVKRLYQRHTCPDKEVTVVPGATEGLFCAIQAVVGAGDEVIVFDPAYDSYDPAVQMAGGRCVHIPLCPPHFGVDWNLVSDAVNHRTRLIIVNTPHNPTSAIFTQSDWDQLADIVADKDIFVLSDEVYEHLVFDGQPHLSVLGQPSLADRAFAVSSFGKTYHVTGWKTGYVVAPPALTHELRKIHQYVAFVGVTPIQYALADFMASCPEHYLELPDFYQEKRDYFCKLLADTRFKYTPTPASYFQLVDYSEISDLGDIAMAEWLTREIGVAAIPISCFFESEFTGKYIRFCFAKEPETLAKAVVNLAEI